VSDNQPPAGSGDEPELVAETFEAAQLPEPGALGVTAARGIGVLVGRTLGLQLLTAAVTVVLARLLTPADYGLFALALAVQLVGTRAAELGLPAALVQMPEDPAPELQQAVAGVLLATAFALSAMLAVAAFAVAPPLGGSRTLEVVAVAGCAIPFYAARAVPMVLMERHLRFGQVAIVETADTLAFNCFALLAAIGGLGAFSLAGAVPIGGLAGVAAAWVLQPFSHRPRLDLGEVRPLAAFGVRISAMQGTFLIRELGFVGLITAIAGAPVAGFYAMAKRLFSFPIAFSSAVGRVAFPALSRDPDLRPHRAIKLTLYTATLAALPLALVAGTIQPLIAVVLGSEWAPTADIVLAGSLGMMFVASAAATTVAFEMSEGHANLPLASSVVEVGSSFLAVTLLIGPLGETGIGLAITVSSLAATGVLIAGTHPRLRRSMLGVLKVALIATVAVLAAQLASVSYDITGLIVAAVIVTVIWLVLELVFSRAELVRVYQIARPLLRRTAAT
jgi:PST family polysaccharide transporter